MNKLKVNVLIIMVCSAIVTAGLAEQLYLYAKANNYTKQQVRNATWKNAVNLLGADPNDHARWCWSKIKTRVVRKMTEDEIQAKKILLRDAIKAEFPNASFERVRDDAWIVDLDGVE